MNRTSIFSENQQMAENLKNRHRVGRFWQIIFIIAIIVGVVALLSLLFNIVNGAFGYVIVENRSDPEMLASQPLEDLTQPELADILRSHLSANRLRAIELEQPLVERSQVDLYALVLERIVDPTIVESYTLTESLGRYREIAAYAREEYPSAEVVFRSWLNQYFMEGDSSRKAELAGIRTALKGSLLLILVTISFAFPIGVSAAIYLEEIADSKNKINKIIQTNIDNLAGVPSIIYGILGLAIFVRTLAPITSGAIFGTGGESGRTILSAGLTLALLILPIIIINAQEAIRAVPNSLRQASYGLGATQWQTIWNHVLPYALPGILTGTILAMSRAFGETAPLIVVGASTMITSDPSGPFSSFTAVPIQIYNWTMRPQEQFRNIAAAASIVLMISLLSLNASAILLRNKFRRQ
ncbi:MAG TPA: phosphate ABC transporter permease PstA [Levilinea sp.]|nr:phosphate ABC transporter permease PstA [Levilinea sp.]